MAHFKSGVASSFLKVFCSNFKFKDRIPILSIRSFQSSTNTSWLFEDKRSNLGNINIERQMAGHAKWQNVAHVKTSKNLRKSALSNKFVWLVTQAVKESGPDPKLNSKLSTLLDQAKKNNIPLSTLENAMKRVNNKKTKSGTVEILGPGGCFLVLEFETDNIGPTRHDLKTICKKYGASLLTGDLGRWRAVFEQRGIIKAVKQKNGEPLNSEKALDDAIEAGAEEVSEKQDDINNTYLEFLCAPNDLFPVKKEIEKLYELEEVFIGYLPTSTVQLDEECASHFENLLQDLENHVDVVRIFENVQ